MKVTVEKVVGARWFPAAVAVTSVAVVILLFCWPTIFCGRTMFHTHGEWPPSDETSIHLPLHVEVGRLAANGEPVTYNQWPAFGQPLASDPDALIFDPFMALFRGCGPATEVLSARVIVMAAVGAFAVFGFLGLFGVSILGSAVGTIVYTALVLRYPTAEEVLVHYAGTSWSMLGLFLLALATRGRRKWAFPLAGVATGLSALSGHPQAALFGFALGGLFVFGQGWPRRGNDTRYAYLGGLGWLLIALAVAAIQLVPLMAGLESTVHVFADPVHPENQEDLTGYALTLLGPGMGVLLLLLTRRRWIEAWTLILMVLFFLTIANTPLVKFWHVVVPFFDHFKLSSKYFVSPFPILAAVGLGLAIGAASNWKGSTGRIGLFACLVCALWAVWGAPLELVHRLQQPASQVEALDPACVRDIRENTPPFGRIVRFDTEALYPSLGVNARIFDVQTSASHIPQRYADLMMAMNPDGAEAIREDSRVTGLTDPGKLELAFWDVAGVTTLVSGRPVDIPGWDLVLGRPDASCMYRNKGYWIYRNTAAFPRAFTVPDATVPDGIRSGLEYVMSPDTAVPARAESTASISRYSGTEVIVDVRGPAESDLVVSDSWSADWRATVDGRPVDIGRTWYLFRSVRVPAGDHVVRMTYRPASLVAGLFLGGAGLLAALGWAVTAAFVLPAWRRRSRGQRSGQSRGSGQTGT